MSAELFLNTLFHGKPEGDHILIWEKRKDKKVSYWFDHPADAIKHFKQQGSKQDTYVGCGTSEKVLPHFRRCKAEEISGIPGAWIDVDILDPVHSKPNLPKTTQDAKEIIESFPLKPTIIVHSGHGYQFWWVFKNFVKFENARQHEEAATLMHEFTWTMRDCARSMGYDLDMTFDLSRVFRIPGGLNHKDDPPLPVTMEQCAENYYTPTEFKVALDAFRIALGDDATPIDMRKNTSVILETVQGATFVLDPSAMPPEEKFKTLMDYDPKFAASWEHRRKDFKSGDESASAYDMSLASFAFAAGWEEQEIVDLLIAFRRVNGLKTKLVESYYRRTLAAASNAIKKDEATETLITLLENKSVTKVDPDKTDEENAVIQNVAIQEVKDCVHKHLDVHLLHFIRINFDPPEYRMECVEGIIHIGGVANLHDQPGFRKKYLDGIRKMLMPFKTGTWKIIVDSLMSLCEEQSAGLDNTNKGMIATWLRSFLTQKPPLYDMTEGLVSHKPFYHKDSLYISGPDLRAYVNRFMQEIVASKTMGLMLKEYGFKPATLNVKIDNKTTTRYAWQIEIVKDKVATEFVNMDMLNNANDLLREAQLAKDEGQEI